jgi:hypothetical protein
MNAVEKGTFLHWGPLGVRSRGSCSTRDLEKKVVLLYLHKGNLSNLARENPANMLNELGYSPLTQYKPRF